MRIYYQQFTNLKYGVYQQMRKNFNPSNKAQNVLSRFGNEGVNKVGQGNNESSKKTAKGIMILTRRRYCGYILTTW